MLPALCKTYLAGSCHRAVASMCCCCLTRKWSLEVRIGDRPLDIMVALSTCGFGRIFVDFLVDLTISGLVDLSVDSLVDPLANLLVDLSVCVALYFLRRVLGFLAGLVGGLLTCQYVSP